MAKPEVGIKPAPQVKLPVFIILSFISGFVGFLPVGLLFNRLWVPLVLGFIGAIVFIPQLRSYKLPVETSLGNQRRIPGRGNLTALGSPLRILLDDLGGEDYDTVSSILQDYHLDSRELATCPF